MTGWDMVDHAITALLSGSLIGVIYAGLCRYKTTIQDVEDRKHRNERETIKEDTEIRRQARADEIAVLYKAIEDTRMEREEVKKDMAKLRDEHQACTTALATMKAQNADQERRILHLERVVQQLEESDKGKQVERPADTSG